MKILIDVMGSDLGPAELLRGVVSATKRFDAELAAVGPQDEIEKIARENGIDLSRISILDAPDVITMEDKPMSVLREKNHSSMANGLRALAHGEADAFVSAGNTGALITGGTMIVRRIRGVSRAAIGTLFPFSAPVLLLDSGANLDVTPDHLEQFAFIGSLYMKKMFGIESPRVGLLNNGVEFQESSATAVEMQLNEQKRANAEELAKLLHISVEAMSGKASADDIAAIARVVAIPLMRAIECALNRSLLLEREKKDHYWAFDTKELLKGDMLSRYQAYQIAVDNNWMGIDEVRYAEDMPKLGLHWIKLGLQDVLYDPKTKTVYTPNTNQVKTLAAATPPEPEGGDEGNADED